jgi:hypothetical protein
MLLLQLQAQHEYYMYKHSICNMILTTLLYVDARCAACSGGANLAGLDFIACAAVAKWLQIPSSWMLTLYNS